MPDVPVVGAGGVRTGFDALSMLLAGATAVQVGTAMLLDPAAPVRIAEELADEIGGAASRPRRARRARPPIPLGEDTA